MLGGICSALQMLFIVVKLGSLLPCSNKVKYEIEMLASLANWVLLYLLCSAQYYSFSNIHILIVQEKRITCCQ